MRPSGEDTFLRRAQGGGIMSDLTRSMTLAEARDAAEGQEDFLHAN